MFNLLDLFAGIGGFSLGLEATEGFSTGAFVEINTFCQKVLKKHWPSVQCYSDIRKVSVTKGIFDVFSGGFPCQDVSIASQGKQESILGDRSGMWWQYLRLIDEGRPTWIIIENVENLRSKGLGIILSQLANLGYDAEWHVIPAYGVGFPHTRKRLWIIANLNSDGIQGNSKIPLQRLQRVPWLENGRRAAGWLRGPTAPNNRLLRSSHGIPDYVDRVIALGNAIVPHIAYEIGLSILEAESGKELS